MFKFTYDGASDQFGYIRKVAGADTFVPFSTGNMFEELYDINTSPYQNPYNRCAGYVILKDGTYRMIQSGTPVSSIFTEDTAFYIDNDTNDPYIYARKAGYFTSSANLYTAPIYYNANQRIDYFLNRRPWIYWGETNPFQ